MEGFDYAWGWHPSLPAAIAKDRKHPQFVMRYLGTTSKCLTLDELHALQARGFAVGGFYETTGATYQQGRPGGITDGTRANAAAVKLGMPPGTPLWFPIDRQTADYSTVKQYYRGCIAASGQYRARLYGSKYVLDAVGGGGHFQTTAWSDGLISKHAGLLQYAYNVNVGGTSMDRCRTLTPAVVGYKGWLKFASSSMPPAPAPAPVPAPQPTPPAVVKAEREVGQSIDHELCLVFVRQAFGLDANGREPTAISAWQQAQWKHPGDAQPPAGVPVFWSGGSTGAGHVAVSIGSGEIVSSDIDGGKVGRVPLSRIHDQWGLTYLGWTEDLEGKRVYG